MVLTGRERLDGSSYQFVTWIWNYDRAGGGHSHYHEGNFQGAKLEILPRVRRKHHRAPEREYLVRAVRRI